MIEGLKKHHTQTCGPLEVSAYFAPTTDLAHLRDIGIEDPYEHSIAFEIVNRDGPAGLTAQLQDPAPLAFFFKIARQDREGRFIDITQSQIDPLHTGEPTPREIRFAANGDRNFARISYAAFRTITDAANLTTGRYRITLEPFEIVTVDGKACLSTVPPMEIEVDGTL
ncbi:hypothetical protein C8N43_1689 [Litoreibacter ponti]|uniref:Uncharacterized protein n=1 Tax=Litoreibacter ponti TaxID=1510457 RepID=A0A2T6BLS0_9RHOB|nr:hypothetical protein [Litoreibacter ponti]PTX57024.1 hypothetical protein C8N43_1689 [Litoreibacter ponti]